MRVKKSWVENQISMLNRELDSLRERLAETQNNLVLLRNAIVLRRGKLQAYEELLEEMK